MAAYSSALLPTYAPYPFPVVAGERDYIVDAAGNRWLDLYGGHCVASTGHCHPTVAAAIAEQAHKLIFYSAAAQLPVRDAAAAALADFAGNGMASVFFCNSGAEANENALKVALQLTGRKKFVAFQGAFHGRTLLALSVTDAPRLRKDFATLLAPAEFLPFGDVAALAAADFSDKAAVIVEPIQSMAGVKTTDAAWFAALRNKCTQSGALLIFDEVQTGIGRLGAPFAANLYGVSPDIITCAKGMASGVPMGGVLMRAGIAAELGPGDLGSTFGGGPLACAALIATLKVISDENLMAHASAVAKHIRANMHGVVRRVRGAGLLLGLEAGTQAKTLKAHLFGRRILVGGSDDPAVLRLMPPLNVCTGTMDMLLDAVDEFGAREAA
ncbi:MAG: aminotransferase class III-fold pyridoxal phosphate-dependent enzyme [Gammaproteobacteria bacterium]|nr:aminotransferase class III-fold pyridoxal phosphate-dependent enzyme [Gammaproteobacteria bacterium]MDE2024004.1 aminotransferase class III-fold pyridoxal phosphate-dependent enzyme [Gammaproteobacteria bacterium]MDE2274389.1 aminotransferase class III-fold pyridoxal phosphate-dependent enzyme [Gammaproteobacteria bacterium]